MSESQEAAEAVEEQEAPAAEEPAAEVAVEEPPAAGETAPEPEAPADEPAPEPVAEEPEPAAEPEEPVAAAEPEEPVAQAEPEEEPDAAVPAPVGPAAGRQAKVFLCDRGHRTVALWSAPTSCHARPTRSGSECGRQLYPIGELPEQVQKALNPLKASKKASKG
jgi:hypothetical protein